MSKWNLMTDKIPVISGYVSNYTSVTCCKTWQKWNELLILLALYTYIVTCILHGTVWKCNQI